MNEKKNHWLLLIIALVLMIGGSSLAGWIQTGAGAARIEEVKFPGIYDGNYDAYLWIPNGVNQENPAPAVLAAHGFNNTKEYMANTALELARRGYVVLSMDLDKHGFSSSSNVPSVGMFAPSPNGIGTYDGLLFLRSLPFVDTDNVAMVGMSMGGMAIDATAQLLPDAYKALFYMDSGCDAACETEHNFAISVGRHIEVPPNFGAINGAEVPNAPRAMEIYGSDGPVIPGNVYGSIEDGTGRVFYDHFGDHPYSTDDPTSIGNVVTWFGMTLDGGKDIPATDQIWQYKVLGTGLGYIGIVVFFAAIGSLLLETTYFSSLKEKLPVYKGNKGSMWWIFAVITAFLGPILLMWAFRYSFDHNWFKLEPVSTGFAGWLAITGIVTVVILVAGYYLWGKKAGVNGQSYGLLWKEGLNWSQIGKSLLLAFITTATGYLFLHIIVSVLKVDFRFWVLTLKTTDFRHILIMLAYLLPLFVYFLSLAVVWHGTLRPRSGEVTMAREITVNAVMLLVGVLSLLGWYYIPLTFFGAPSNLGPSGLGLINAIALVGIVPAVAAISTYFYRLTGKVYVGALINTMFVAWFLVAANTVQGFG